MEDADVGTGRRFVEAERFDAVDRAGRRRASFGLLGPYPGQGDLVGLELVDKEGGARVTLTLDDTGVAALSFALGGNEVLVVAVADDDGDVSVRATACDVHGEPAVSLEVDGVGEVRVAHHAPGGGLAAS